MPSLGQRLLPAATTRATGSLSDHHGSAPPRTQGQSLPKSRLPQPTQIARLQPPNAHAHFHGTATMSVPSTPVSAAGGAGNRIRVRIKRSELDRVRTCIRHSRDQEQASPLRQVFVAWRQLTAQSRALWRLQIKLAARVRYTAMMCALRVMRQRLRERREERLAAQHYRNAQARLILNHWQSQLDWKQKHQSDHDLATRHHASVLVASTFLRMLVAFRRRHHLTVLLSAARHVHQRNLLFRSLTHWSDATIEQKRLRAPLAWAQRQVANVVLATKTINVWAARMAQVKRERELRGIADRVCERAVKQRVLGAWVGQLERVRQMQVAANAHLAAIQGKQPSRDQSVAHMRLALDRWRSVLVHYQSLEVASTLAVQHAQECLQRRVMVAWNRKLACTRQLTQAAHKHHVQTHLAALRLRLAAFLTHWRAATTRRIQSHALAARVAQFRSHTLASRALRAWVHDTRLRKARGQLKTIAGSIYSANLAAHILRSWSVRVEQVRDERTQLCRIVAWATLKSKQRAWTAWVLVCEMRRVKEERRRLAGEYCEHKRVGRTWERWVARCARVRWERESNGIAHEVASHRLRGAVVKAWRDRLVGRRREQAIVAECELRRAERWIVTCMRAWVAWVKEGQLEKTQVEVADTWNAVRLIRTVLARGMAEVRLTTVGRAVHEEQMLNRVVGKWMSKYRARMDENGRVDEYRAALGKRIVERHLIAWLLHTKSVVLKHLKRDRAIRLHQAHLVSSALRHWSAKSSQKRHHWVQAQKALAFHNSSMLCSTFRHWHASRPDWSRVYARNLARPREFHDLGILRKAFDIWRVEVVKRKAAVWRMGVVERLRKVQTGLGERHAQEAASPHVAMPSPRYMRVRRIQDSAVELELDVGYMGKGVRKQRDDNAGSHPVIACEFRGDASLTLHRKQPRLWPSDELAHLLVRD
ncbi:hypothetical protein BCR44DRAFT_1444807 [Catenaria anguillulae PL171]|uniref:Sfi1 spindle body protein-domain-containing protein n=1 Tax=Catenaria anguillulae PL171 TaxID=765915 RepID=A0A1Y2H797_9FUNG|nr:hypothetical protein BCR44DRAFT_1444807 [Catenaria anguillulae PL171]